MGAKTEPVTKVLASDALVRHELTLGRTSGVILKVSVLFSELTEVVSKVIGATSLTEEPQDRIHLFMDP